MKKLSSFFGHLFYLTCLHFVLFFVLLFLILFSTNAVKCVLAKFHYLLEIQAPYDQFRSYFPNKCGLREDPVFQRGTVFICAYQAVTSESESKVRLLSPFLQPPAFDTAGALRLRQIVLEARQNLSNTGQKYQNHIDPTTGKHYSTPMYCVVNTKDMFAKLKGLAESIQNRVDLLLKEQKAIADDHLELLRVAESFAQPTKANEDKE